MKETNTENVLKKLASDAKYRLKHCNYNNKQENLNIKRNIAFQNHIRMIKESECKTPEITIKIINDYDNNEFKQKVFDLLNENKDSLNPLSRLINQAEFENMSENEDCLNPLKKLSDNKLLCLMSDSEKQRYILDLSERYNQVRDDYYKSKRAYM